jgi:rSAM/selenodomain-associated transferase 2
VLSIVVPVLDEAALIERCLEDLQALRARGVEVVVVDGGSRDGTPAIAARLCDAVIASPRGRARQMNAGASAARGEILMFLHVDCTLPQDAERLVGAALAGGARRWGRFDVALEGSHPLLRVIGRAMNLRSRLTGICTGDQAIFMAREAFDAVGGFPAIPLMEDIAISRTLKRVAGRPACLADRVLASGRRWEQAGAWRTMLLMWRLRLAYFLGTDPARLARRYDGPAR